MRNLKGIFSALLVSFNEDGSINIKSVDTFYLQGYEVKAIQELHQMIKMQQQMIYNLQFEVAKLQA